MLSKWPIRVKLLVGFALLVLVVGILSSSGLYTMYAYRDLVKNLNWRVGELPLAAELGRHVGDLRVTLSRLHELRQSTFSDTEGDQVPLRVRMLRDEFRIKLDQVGDTFTRYRKQLAPHEGDPSTLDWRADSSMADNQHEWETVGKIEAALQNVHRAYRDEDWMLDAVKVGLLDGELKEMQSLCAELPSYLHAKLAGYKAAVTQQYRMLIVGTWTTSISAALLFALFMQLCWRWILRPLRILIYGSRVVASGRFNHRIHLDAEDEMAELAEAMNDMTARFQDIRDDLDRQVQQRTRQVVRSEQLASVGFLAAGVAHEINNPLASIAICAESLQSRIGENFDSAADGSDGDAADRQTVIDNYLQMIQDEAFRCKEITEKLLDFSRIGQIERQHADLGELVQGVVEMLGHLGRYQQKQIQFVVREPVIADVNAQEIKQVVLNLLTNALDSLEADGLVEVELHARGGFAELTFRDNGCGMEPEVLKHVFEPFFTRRRAGQGTGLGLSITYRIVADHGGSIEVQSPGPGQGATFRVRLPLTETHKEINNQYQAA